MCSATISCVCGLPCGLYAGGSCLGEEECPARERGREREKKRERAAFSNPPSLLILPQNVLKIVRLVQKRSFTDLNLNCPMVLEEA